MDDADVDDDEEEGPVTYSSAIISLIPIHYIHTTHTTLTINSPGLFL